jgi:hypothetical protein
VAGRVKDQVFAFCDKQGFAFVGRSKTQESLTEKLETGRYGGWGDVDDLYACTIVIPALDREKEVRAFLATTYEQVSITTRGSTLKDPSVFRFDATRFVGIVLTCYLRTIPHCAA